MPIHPTTTEQKQALRRAMRSQLRELPSDLRMQKSEHIWAQVEQHPAFAQARTALLYAALPDEPASLQFVERWRTRKQILLPMVQGNALAVGKADALQPAPPFGILEPRCALNSIPSIDIVLVPALAFDREGYRLGRGKGYYDRFLPSTNAFRMGVCFDFQLLDALPHEEWDVRVREVITN